MGRRSRYPEKRADIIATVVNAVDGDGQSPTLREIAEKVDVSVGTLHSYLSQLEGEGLVEWKPKLHRSLKPTPKGRRLHEASSKVPF